VPIKRENNVSTINWLSQARRTMRGAYCCFQFGATGMAVARQSRRIFFSVEEKITCTPQPSMLRLQTDPIPEKPPGPQSIKCVTPYSGDAAAIAFGQCTCSVHCSLTRSASKFLLPRRSSPVRYHSDAAAGRAYLELTSCRRVYWNQ